MQYEAAMIGAGIEAKTAPDFPVIFFPGFISQGLFIKV